MTVAARVSCPGSLNRIPELSGRSERRERLKTVLIRLWNEEQAQDLLEYALVLVLIALVAVAAANPLGASIANIFAGANSCTESAAHGGGCRTST